MYFWLIALTFMAEIDAEDLITLLLGTVRHVFSFLFA